MRCNNVRMRIRCKATAGLNTPMSSPTRLLRSRRPAPLPSQYAPCTKCKSEVKEYSHSTDPSSSSATAVSPTQTFQGIYGCGLLRKNTRVTLSLFAELSEDAVREYLRFHRDFLEKFILQDVSQDTLERLLIRRAQIEGSGLEC